MIWPRIVISTLIGAAGIWGAYTLTTVDQELRVLYAEYTLATTNLGHINAQLIRYRTSVLRAIAADTREEYQRIVEVLPLKRNRIEQPLEQFIKATQATSSKHSEVIEELAELRSVKARVAEYMATSDQTIQFLNRRGFDITAALRVVCVDITTRLPELQHVDMTRVALRLPCFWSG